jgi:hypothetical protein
MRARFMLAMLAVPLLLAGCGSTHSSRPAVARYIKQVNAIEAQLAGPLGRVTKAGSQFASSGSRTGGTLGSLSGLAQQQSLLSAQVRIRSLARKLAAIAPPPGAAELRKLVLELSSGEAGMTHELTELVEFLPRFSSGLQSLTPATAKLRAALAVTQPLGSGAAGATAELAVKERALLLYQRELADVVRRLRRLVPPPVSRPQYVTEVGTLRRMSADAGRLARALTAGAPDVRSLLVAFDTAAEGTQTVAAQRAEIAAIRAYNARVSRLSLLAQKVEAERLKLANTLG